MSIPRILYLANNFLPPGGVQNLSALALLVLDELERDGKLEYCSIVRDGNVPPNVRSARAFGFGALMQAKVVWSVVAHHPDCIFSDHFYTARFASRLGTRHIFWAHLIEFDPPLDEMHQRSLDSSFRIVCNSEYTYRHLATLYPNIKHKLRVVQLGDQPRELLDRPLYRQNVNACRFTMIGRMVAAERYKGHDQVLEALPLVLARFPNCKIDMVGSGSDRGRLMEKAKALGVADNVSFPGSLDENSLFATIKSSTGSLLPSLREGFGLVYLYAMWAGLPAVAVKGTAAEEVLGSCGIYAESQTPEAIAIAMTEVLSGGWIFSDESQLRYKTNFSYKAFRERLSQFVLNEALASV
jgi:phosphatidylinositol alpha-1,6-mannosyltransferase